MNPQNKPFKVYQASAGSGKTYTIVKEYLSLCLKSEASTANYSHILAITFTNKAANEMKEKITAQLNLIIDSDPNEAPQNMEADLIEELNIERNTLKNNAKLLFQKIIHDYSSFCVSTIDAFFQKVARTFAKDLNLPSQFNVSIDEDEVADAITDRIGEQLGVNNPFLTKILEDYCEMKFESDSKPKVAQNIHSFVTELFKESTFQKNEQNQFLTEEQYKETQEYFYKNINGFESSCKEFLVQFDKFLNDNTLTANDFKGKSRSPILSLVNKLKEKKYELLTASQEKILDDDNIWYANDRIATLDYQFRDLTIPFIKRYQSEITNYLFLKEQIKQLSFYVLRSKIKAEIDDYIGEEMVVHISEFNKRINDILGDFSVPFIYERLGEHFKHIFIDEFQDTSILQWQNILPLIDNNLANQHLNMIVGDGKQSIYRWRNGEVGQIVSLPLVFNKPEKSPAFDIIEQNLVNNFNFNELDHNYRSFRNIVDFNNAFFLFGSNNYLSEEAKKVYVNNDEVLNKHVGIKQEGVIEEKGLVQVELFNPEEPMDEPMLTRIKELIEELLDHGFNKGDITILVRYNSKGSLVANYLHSQGIEVISPEAILLKSSEKVLLIISTLQYLIHSDNKVAIANVLYHWDATHVTDFKGDVSQTFVLVNDIADGKVSLEEQLQLKPHQLHSLLANAYSLYDLCSAIARVYGFNTVSDSFINFLLDKVYDWQSADAHGIERFLDYWDKKQNSLSILTNDTDAVKVMTIHKSKGLEFPVVIYPFVNDDIVKKTTKAQWFTPEQLGFQPIPNISKIQFTLSDSRSKWTPQVATLRKIESDKMQLDKMNLHYVAFTRAKQRLYVMTQASKDFDKMPINAFLQSPNSPSDLDIKHVENETDWPSVYQLGDPETNKVEKKNSEGNEQVFEFLNESSSGDWFNKISIDPNPSMFWATESRSFEPREWGLLVHQILSEVEHSEDLDRVLQPYIDDGTIDEPTANMLAKVFHDMVNEPTISEAFSAQAKVRNERELLTDDNTTKRPDRFAELPDKIYLLDYKTGQPNKDDIEQLAGYKRILQTMVTKPIYAYLVYLNENNIQIIHK